MNLKQLIIIWNKNMPRGAQTRLAEAAGVTPSLVAQWVRGVGPAEGRWPELAKILRVSIEELEKAVAETKRSVLHPLQGQNSNLLLKAVHRIERLEARIDDLEKAFFLPEVRRKIMRRKYSGRPTE